MVRLPYLCARSSVHRLRLIIGVFAYEWDSLPGAEMSKEWYDETLILLQQPPGTDVSVTKCSVTQQSDGWTCGWRALAALQKWLYKVCVTNIC